MKYISLRLADQMYATIKEQARESRRSMNAQILTLIDTGLAQTDKAPTTEPTERQDGRPEDDGWTRLA